MMTGVNGMGWCDVVGNGLVIWTVVGQCYWLLQAGDMYCYWLLQAGDMYCYWL